jgi:hypothetical protein
MFGLDGHFDYIVMHHLYGLAFFSLGALPRVIGDHPRDAAPSSMRPAPRVMAARNLR